MGVSSARPRELRVTLEWVMDEDPKTLFIRHLKPSPNERLCTECAGEGIVEYAFTDDKADTYYIDGDCPLCQGSGLIERPPETIKYYCPNCNEAAFTILYNEQESVTYYCLQCGLTYNPTKVKWSHHTCRSQNRNGLSRHV